MSKLKTGTVDARLCVAGVLLCPLRYEYSYLRTLLLYFSCAQNLVFLFIYYFFYFFFTLLFSFGTRAGSPHQREPIDVDPYYLAPLSTFPVGGDRSTWRKPTTFGRALTIHFSYEDWLRVHIRMNHTADPS